LWIFVLLSIIAQFEGFVSENRVSFARILREGRT
jgi:hypothetical protein